MSTAGGSDEVRAAVLQPDCYDRHSLETMLTSQKTTAGERTGYGIGWGVETSGSGKLIYEHFGGAVGGTSQLIVYPESRIVVVVVGIIQCSVGTKGN